jgi:hypothetical protein
MGAYSGRSLGPMLFSGNVTVLVGVYTLDLILSRKSLISDAISPSLIDHIIAAHIGAVCWAGFCCLYLSPLSPRLGIAGIVAYVVMHWISIWWFEPQMHAARAAIETRE